MDTAIKNEDKLLRKILTSLRPGAILLLHDHPEITLHALTKIIAGIREKGYRIVRLDKMINLNPYA
jgi:peptidoglycan/xylan/chitin deacetylase (PgdA/CDA1 family)